MSIYLVAVCVVVAVALAVFRRWRDHVDRAWYDEIRRRERLLVEVDGPILVPHDVDMRRLRIVEADRVEPGLPGNRAADGDADLLRCEDHRFGGDVLGADTGVHLTRGGVLRADTWQRLPGSYHGSGCTLASALAANLARGLDIGDAVYEAQDYTWQALANAFRPGMGQYLPDRLFWARESEDGDEK